MPGTIEAREMLVLAIVPGSLTIAAWSRARTWSGLASDRFFTLLPGFRPIVPSAWDEVFDRHEMPPSGVAVVAFQDGYRVGGGWGRGSDTITSPQKQRLVLGTEWELDNQSVPVRPLPNSQRVLSPDGTTIGTSVGR